MQNPVASSYPNVVAFPKHSQARSAATPPRQNPPTRRHVIRGLSKRERELLLVTLHSLRGIFAPEVSCAA